MRVESWLHEQALRWRRKGEAMNPVRGVVMVIAAGLAFYRGWKIHTGETAILAYGLGLLALVLAVWHFTRLASRPKV